MSKFLRETDRVPCEDHHANAPLTQEHSLGDVVEPLLLLVLVFTLTASSSTPSVTDEPTIRGDHASNDSTNYFDHDELVADRAISHDDEYDARGRDL